MKQGDGSCASNVKKRRDTRTDPMSLQEPTPCPCKNRPHVPARTDPMSLQEPTPCLIKLVDIVTTAVIVVCKEEKGYNGVKRTRRECG